MVTVSATELRKSKRNEKLTGRVMEPRTKCGNVIRRKINVFEKENWMDKKTIVFDFDGGIHSYTSGWQGISVIPDPVVPEIQAAINYLRMEGYEVIVVSTRCARPEGMGAVRRYLRDNHIVVDDVVAHKPPAICYIDDRAICFDGNALGLIGKIRAFKPWYQN